MNAEQVTEAAANGARAMTIDTEPATDPAVTATGAMEEA